MVRRGNWESCERTHGKDGLAVTLVDPAKAWLLEKYEKALGIQGNVTVQFRVHANGRVSDLSIVKPSGQPALDLLALHRLDRVAPHLGHGAHDVHGG